MSAGKPGRGSDQFPLRLPDGMRDRLKTAAEANSRSMNAEIVARLEESFDTSPDQPDLKEAQRIIHGLLAAMNPKYASPEDQRYLDGLQRDGFLFLAGVPAKWINELDLWEMAETRIDWAGIDNHERCEEFREYIDQNKYNAVSKLLHKLEALGYSFSHPAEEE